MKEINRKASGINTYGKYLGLTIGIVKNNADPGQHGRLQVYVPAYDPIDFEVVDLPWCNYVSPFGGVTANFAVGPEQKQLPGVSAYGFWAIPKNGAQVLVGCIDGNPMNRFWMGCIYQPEFNRTMPSGIDGVQSEIDDSGTYPQQDFPHMKERLSDAGLWKSDAHFKTRGGYERSISHPSNKNTNKPTDNGYAPKALEKDKADSQAVVLTSPGRHMFLMSDVDEHCRIRIKTTNGQQVIFDDTNERIYISSGKGKNWIELDESNGKVYIYSDSKISIRSKNDLNLYSDKNVNIVAKHRVNIQSEERAVKITGKRNIEVLSTDGNVKISASRDMHLKTFDGPRAGSVAFSESCSSAGLLRDFEEEAGSSTSRIYIEAVQGGDIKIERGPLIMTARDKAELKATAGNVNVQANGTMNLKANGGMNVEGGATVNIKGSMINESAGAINLQAGSIIGTNYLGVFIGSHVNSSPPSPGPAGSADGASSASSALKADYTFTQSFMVRPDHESWIRDEDEATCPTIRNPKFIYP